MKVQELMRRLKSMPKNADVHVYAHRTKSAPAVTDVAAVVDNRVFVYTDTREDK